MSKKMVLQIGSERPEFQVEPTPVVIHKTVKDRAFDAGWMIPMLVIANVVAMPIIHLLIFPLF